jgi:hypothetical protein
MTTVYTINKADPSHLEKVKADMAQLGAPKIDVVDCGDYYMALEGSHRLIAAEELGITPEFRVFEQHDAIDIAAYDWFNDANWVDQDASYTAGEVAGELFSVSSIQCRF